MKTPLVTIAVIAASAALIQAAPLPAPEVLLETRVSFKSVDDLVDTLGHLRVTPTRAPPRAASDPTGLNLERVNGGGPVHTEAAHSSGGASTWGSIDTSSGAADSKSINTDLSKWARLRQQERAFLRASNLKPAHPLLDHMEDVYKGERRVREKQALEGLPTTGDQKRSAEATQRHIDWLESFLKSKEKEKQPLKELAGVAHAYMKDVKQNRLYVTAHEKKIYDDMMEMFATTGKSYADKDDHTKELQKQIESLKRIKLQYSPAEHDAKTGRSGEHELPRNSET